jgi:hypothetical protein
MLTSNITFENHDDLVAYLRALKEGDRVIETGRSGLHALQGTVYLKDGPCVRWDEMEGQKGRMGTSATGGTRLISDTNLSPPT